MQINSDYSITRLFITKNIRISIDNKKYLILKLKTIKDLYLNSDWNIVYHLWTADPNSLKEKLGMSAEQNITSFDIIKIILFKLGQFSEFRSIYTLFVSSLKELFTEVDLSNQSLTINGVTITDDIWEYVVYLLKLSYGEKVEKPLVFSSEEAKQFYLAQKAYEDKIKKLRTTQDGDAEGLIKTMLSIIYKFPSFTIEYLFDQTMAQILWLQKLAAGAVSYEVNAQAFAAGNMKKGKKLDFFIK